MSKISVKTRGPKSFRRAGHDFSPTATELDLASLSPEQLEQLRAESGEGGMLEVTGLPGGRAARGTQPHEPSSPSKGEMQTGGPKPDAPAASSHSKKEPR